MTVERPETGLNEAVEPGQQPGGDEAFGPGGAAANEPEGTGAAEAAQAPPEPDKPADAGRATPSSAHDFVGMRITPCRRPSGPRSVFGRFD